MGAEGSWWCFWEREGESSVHMTSLPELEEHPMEGIVRARRVVPGQVLIYLRVEQ